MKLSRPAIGFAVVGATVVAAMALAQPRASGPAAAATGMDQFFGRLDGEWEGEVQTMQPGGGVSGSIASLSTRAKDDRRSLTTCFEGFSFGQPFEGAAFISFNAKRNQFQQVWFDSVSNTTVTGVAQSMSKDSITFAGQATDRTGAATSFEQVLTFGDDRNFTCEYVTVGSNGQRTSVMKMDLTRMPKGSRSLAADRFNNAPLLARVCSPDQQASADSAR